MRVLNTTEITAVSGGTFLKSCKPKKPVCAKSCFSPLELAVGFVAGAVKLLCTGKPSPMPECPTDDDSVEIG